MSRERKQTETDKLIDRDLWIDWKIYGYIQTVI